MIPGDLMADIRNYLAPTWPSTQCLRAKVYGRLLLDHIDAMAAGEAKLRALHREDGGGCAHCLQPWPDDYQTWGAAKWPCETMKILDGIE